MADPIHEDELWGSDYQFEQAIEWFKGARNEHDDIRKKLAIFKRLSVKFVEGDGWFAVDYESESGWKGPYLEMSEAEQHALEQLEKHGYGIAERMGRVK